MGIGRGRYIEATRVFVGSARTLMLFVDRCYTRAFIAQMCIRYLQMCSVLFLIPYCIHFYRDYAEER